MMAWDEHLFRFCYASGEAHLLPWMIGLSLLGSGWAMLALVPLLIREDTRRWAAWLTTTLLVTAVVVFALKIAVGRARPIVALEGVHPLYGSPTDFSFP